MEIGVVIPNFNYGRFLGACLRSFLRLRVPTGVIFRQLTIVDDGSTDNSVEVIEEFRERFESRGIRYEVILFPENRGVSAAFNAGIERTGTEWIFPFGSDNKVLPGCLEEVYKTAYPDGKRVADIVPLGWKGFGINHDGTPYNRTRIYRKHITPEDVAQGRNLSSGCSPYIRKTWEDYPYREDLLKGEDGDRWKRLVERGYTFEPTRKVCALVRGHKLRLSAQSNPAATIARRKKLKQ